MSQFGYFYNQALMPNRVWLRKRGFLRFTLSLFLTLFLTQLLLGCTQPRSNLLEQTFYTFGTEITIQIAHPDLTQAQAAISQIEQRFYAFHQQWHAWQSDSMLSAINRAIAAGEPIKVDSQTQAFIEKSQQLSAQTDYLFDPAIGGLLRLWGFQGQTDWQPPSEHERQVWLQNRPSIADIYFIDKQLHSHHTGVQLDFGGNAKGLALEIANAILNQHHIEHALINIGGDLLVRGRKSNNQAWSIGIQNPQNPAQAIAQIQAQDGDTIFTSGTYQRYFEWQGQRYSHILNPNTAWPADSFASVTVIHPDPILADTAATALLIAGPKHGQRIAQQLGVTKILTIDQQGHVNLSPEMQRQTKRLD
jgi:thiamine biosynthesis lipoprotein